MLTVIKGVSIAYSLALPVRLAKATQEAKSLGTWLGDMGNEFHQWEGGDPGAGKRRGDHTAWSSDGPRGVVKAFDWAPDNMGRFQTWLLAALHAGRYAHVVKFANLNNRQYGPRGQYQGHTGDHHLHVSFFPAAVNARVDILADYLAAQNQSAPGAATEDDMEPKEIATAYVPRPANIKPYLGTTGKPAKEYVPTVGYLMHGTYSKVAEILAAVTAGNAADATRDDALQAALTHIIAASGGNIDTATVIAAVKAEADKTRAAVVQIARDQLGAVAGALEIAAGSGE